MEQIRTKSSTKKSSNQEEFNFWESVKAKEKKTKARSAKEQIFDRLNAIKEATGEPLMTWEEFNLQTAGVKFNSRKVATIVSKPLDVSELSF